MKAQPECDHCFMRQASDAAKRAELSSEATQSVLTAVREELKGFAADVIPPVRASRIHALIREISGNPDPYQAAKQEATEHALGLYPQLKQMVIEADDPLDSAIRLTIAGNIIDLGVASEYDLEASIERVLAQPLAIDHLDRLKSALQEASSVLYLADNAGETVMDRLLIELLEQPVTYVVKGGPAVNDATRKDAINAGLEGECELIDHGAATLGTLLDQCTPAFREQFEDAELIIAKGMANYESLSGSRAGLFFLLQAKCAVIAKHLDVPEKSIIVMEDSPA